MAQHRHHFPAGPTPQELREMSGLDLLRVLDLQHGPLGWERAEHAEFAAITLVVELPAALLGLLQRALDGPVLGENPRS